MPKQLVIEPCIVNYQDDRGGVHADMGDEISPNTEQALKLAQMHKAVYLSADDDPTKGRYTIRPDLAAAKAAAEAAMSQAPAEAPIKTK